MLTKPLKLISTYAPKPGEWTDAKDRMTKYIRYYRGLYRDERTPKRAKIMLGAALAYLFSPFDLIPDFIPVLGQLDDLVIVPFMFSLADRAIPEDVKRHWANKVFPEVETPEKLLSA